MLLFRQSETVSLMSQTAEFSIVLGGPLYRLYRQRGHCRGNSSSSRRGVRRR